MRARPLYLAPALAGLACILALACASQTVTPGPPAPPSAACAYPRACYLTNPAKCDCHGPLGVAACRVISLAKVNDLGGPTALPDAGKPPELLSFPYAPAATDPADDCPLIIDGGLPDGWTMMTCAEPETLCGAEEDQAAPTDGPGEVGDGGPDARTGG